MSHWQRDIGVNYMEIFINIEAQRRENPPKLFLTKCGVKNDVSGSVSTSPDRILRKSGQQKCKTVSTGPYEIEGYGRNTLRLEEEPKLGLVHVLEHRLKLLCLSLSSMWGSTISTISVASESNLMLSIRSTCPHPTEKPCFSMDVPVASRSRLGAGAVRACDEEPVAEVRHDPPPTMPVLMSTCEDCIVMLAVVVSVSPVGSQSLTVEKCKRWERAREKTRINHTLKRRSSDQIERIKPCVKGIQWLEVVA
ncbi:hypothetical protein DFH07DRAFT_773703 [Mycena maculata]|uniref:Uncharacterized protein n=1 Tax=Mycena maculata TaxID=230809 RepID=A0AAD7NCA7_9AGAR|nr:hypothetical protein DFH07DRAFT_773703 [Mycena maculata]